MATKKAKNDGIGGIISRRAAVKSFRKGTKKLRESGKARRLLRSGEGQFGEFGMPRRRAQKKLFRSILKQR